MNQSSRKAASGRRIPTVSIVGAGRLGTALGLALEACGYRVEAVVTKRKSHARASARLFSTEPLALSSSELERLPSSDLIFISTPDDRIHETAARIASRIKESSHRTALHTSGALSSNELKSLRDVGLSTGSMHPLVAVSDSRSGAESLRRAFFCIEGERRALSVARRIVRDLGAHAFSIKTKEKALYHAAAVTASGHMVALFDIAAEMLVRCGLKASEARAILMPLVWSTVDNLSEQEPSRALTGTFARADLATVQRHLEAIGKENLSDALAVYVLLGERSLRLAAQNGMDRAALKRIAMLLSQFADE